MIREHRFSKDSLHTVDVAVGIIKAYQEKDIRMTLRQLYYQLVAGDYIRNTQKEYARLSRLITDARYAGHIPWSAIEDRVRIPRRHPQYTGLPHLIEVAKYSYRLDRWKDQGYYVELHTEKDAISSVIQPLTDKYHIYMSVNRGYSSASAMYGTSSRFLNQECKNCVILYLGDHDPSGLDMIRDIIDRLEEFGVELEVRHIALTSEQVEEYKPPPNPAKITDPRATGYIKHHGNSSWEVDALKPDVLMRVIEREIQELVDIEKMEAIIRREKRDIKKLEGFVKGL
jgi:hypothetical protein